MKTSRLLRVDLAVMVSFRSLRPASLLFLLVMTVVESQENVDVRYTLHSVCALRGSTVTMGCSHRYRFIAITKSVFWSKEESVVGVLNESSDLALDPEYRDRVRYGRDTRRDCSLTLSDVTEHDQGKYYATIIMTSERRVQGRGGVSLSVTELQVEMVPESVVEGGEVTLTCKSTCSLTNAPIFTWYKNGRDLHSFYWSDRLHLQSVSQEDAGSYSCAVQGESYRSPAVTLNVHSVDPPKSVSVSVRPSGEIVEGGPVILTCSSDANPAVEDYAWYKGTTLLRTGNDYFIGRISSEDSGEYKCKARNQYGEKYSDGAVLNVLYPPKTVSVSVRPSGKIVEGGPVTLTCSSDANPAVEDYAWYKGTTFIGIGKQYFIRRASSEDSGEYKCEARNRYGEKNSDGATLIILDPTSRVFVSISPPGEIVEGGSVTLTCSSDANPPVEYTWFKGVIFMRTGKTYTISKISSEDSGEYKCKSSSRYGEKYSNKVTLQVLYAPKSVSVSISSSGEIVEGGVVTLSCSSDANPPVETYTWYKVNESSPVGSGQSYSFTLSSRSSGWFYCVAQNKFGSQSAAAVPLTSDVSLFSGHSFSYMAVCIAVGVGLCGVGVLTAGLFCMRRMMQKRNAARRQDGGTRAEDVLYASLEPMTRTPNDVYSTLATGPHPRPPEDTYTALEPQTISPDYNTLTAARKHH
ncbi:B-cell receptor CD22 [Ictalurus punctatus]|uniref:B-cell receptor CD22 n=1 Tax=Ictalurus punctatus TaxID=7998 RepID=A0A9F7QY41_ICTPU|nr:B-cell receptor CD22 [Ictalurus punctatus]